MDSGPEHNTRQQISETRPTIKRLTATDRIVLKIQDRHMTPKALVSEYVDAMAVTVAIDWQWVDALIVGRRWGRKRLAWIQRRAIDIMWPAMSIWQWIWLNVWCAILLETRKRLVTLLSWLVDGERWRHEPQEAVMAECVTFRLFQASIAEDMSLDEFAALYREIRTSVSQPWVNWDLIDRRVATRWGHYALLQILASCAVELLCRRLVP